MFGSRKFSKAYGETPATGKQKQYLRTLGYKPKKGLTLAKASKKIDKLLAAERKSGKTFACPYCKEQFGPRPKSSKRKCPSCKQTMYMICGKFYTELQKDKKYERDWFKESAAFWRDTIRHNWLMEKPERREYKQLGRCFVDQVGFLLRIGSQCAHAQDLDGLFVFLEDAYDTPKLLPPYDGCQRATCDCDCEELTIKEVRNRVLRVAEWTDPKEKAKLKTRSNSPISIHRCASVKKDKSGGVMIKDQVGQLGCAGLFLAIVACPVWLVWLWS